MEITSADQLRALVGAPSERAVIKERDRLAEIDRAWLAATPFCVLATADNEGRCDASPKGDPAGRLVHVIDDGSIAIAERPGNRRVDGYLNVLANPHVEINFLIPGRGDTLRINGRARLVDDAAYFDAMAVKGKRPILALEVRIETVFFHCAKAFLRGGVWDPSTWAPEAAPSRAEVAHALERPEEPLEALRDYYGPSYGARLYG